MFQAPPSPTQLLVLIAPHPLLRVCFIFQERCVMTKTSPPRMCAVRVVSCPYEVWGPSQLRQPHPAFSWRRRVTPAPHPVLSCLHSQTSHTQTQSCLIHHARLILSPSFVLRRENADTKLPFLVRLPVLLLLAHSCELQRSSGLFTIHHRVLGG